MLTTRLQSFILMIIIMSVLSLLSFYEYYALSNLTIVDEGAFIETLSACAFFCAGTILLFQLSHKKGLEKLNTAFFATSCFLFFIKEVEMEHINPPQLILFFSDGIGRATLFIGTYITIITLAITRYKVLNAQAIRGYLKSPITKIVIAACLAILAGEILEELHLQLLEELSEMNASLLILLAAIIHQKEPIWEGSNA